MIIAPPRVSAETRSMTLPYIFCVLHVSLIFLFINYHPLDRCYKPPHPPISDLQKIYVEGIQNSKKAPRAGLEPTTLRLKATHADLDSIRRSGNTVQLRNSPIAPPRLEKERPY